MAHRLTLNSITPKTQDWISKIQVIDKFPPRDTKDKAKKYQLLLLQDEEENQILATIWNADITQFTKHFKPFQTYRCQLHTLKTQLMDMLLHSTDSLGQSIKIPFFSRLTVIPQKIHCLLLIDWLSHLLMLSTSKPKTLYSEKTQKAYTMGGLCCALWKYPHRKAQ